MNALNSALPDPQFQPEFYADIPTKRLIAWGIDMVIVVVLSVLAVILTAFVGAFFFFIIFGVLNFFYRVLTIGGNASATLGMRVMAIELRAADGSRLSMPMAFAHTALYFLVFMTFLLQIGSIFAMLATPRKQGLHDLVLGTAMINKPSAY